MINVRLSADGLLLRPWEVADAGDLVEVYRDSALRRWTDSVVEDVAGAARWVREQHEGWAAGRRFGFAVVECGAEGERERVVGQVVLKRPDSSGVSAEVGYWTAAHARGRGVAPSALGALTEWAFTRCAGPGTDGVERLELLHQVDNTASCRVARKCGYELSTVLRPSPPTFPLEGHVHVLTREGWAASQ